MRLPFFLLSIFCLVAGATFLRAQTAASAPATTPEQQNAKEKAAVGFLTPAQQEQYMKAHAKALEDNPALKEEGDDLKAQVEADPMVLTTTAFIEKMRSHRQKLRAAMLKVDPTLEPIFTEIDNHLSKMKAKQLGSVQNSDPASGSNSH